MRTKPSNNTTTRDRELIRARRLMRHKCKPGGECCPVCADLFSRRRLVEVTIDVKTAEAAE